MSEYRLAVFGNPIAHSRSPQIHRRFAAQAGIALRYERVLVPAGEFRPVARRFFTDGDGCNVTLPCKRDAWRFVDLAGDSADKAEAVNTISKTGDGRLRGDNTDGPGLVRDLTGNLGWPIGGRRVLLLGAGGAVSGVVGSILAARPASLHIHNRTMARAERLAGRFGGALQAVPAGALETAYDLVINGSSAGLLGGDLAVPGHIIGPGTRCYDMVYGAGVTAFNGWCRAQADCEVADGLGMLAEQAALAFSIWFNVEVATAEVMEEVRASL